MDPEVSALIELYGLVPLPVEGTMYASTWVSSQLTLEGGPAGTAIVALYTDNPPSRSLFHRLAFDEVWHFYGGDPLRLVLLHPGGLSEEVVLGRDFRAGQRAQFVIPAGTWQAGEMVTGGRWSLFGCTMAPGFVGAAFEGGRVSQLLADYPDRAADIERLGVPDDETSAMPDGFTQ